MRAKVCACGCGDVLPARAAPQRKFLPHHNRRGPYRQARRRADPDRYARDLRRTRARMRRLTRERMHLTPELLAQARRRQAGRCAICWRAKRLVADHDHAASRFRGLLCRSCNAALGLLRDDAQALRRALAYLQR